MRPPAGTQRGGIHLYSVEGSLRVGGSNPAASKGTDYEEFKEFSGFSDFSLAF
jgi:hypothetical protein